MKKRVFLLLVVLFCFAGLYAMSGKQGAKEEAGEKKESATGEARKEDRLDFTGVDVSQIKVKNMKKLTEDGIGYANPKWSPDGRYIAFTKAGAGGNVWIMNVETKEKIEITKADRGGTKFYWAPDSEKIAYINKRKADGVFKNVIAVARIDRKELRTEEEIVDKTADELVSSISTIWSMTGDKIKYMKEKDKKTAERNLGHKMRPTIKDVNPLAVKNKKVMEKNRKIYMQDEKGKEIKIAEYGYEPEIVEDGKVRYKIDDELYVVFDGYKRKVFYKARLRHGYLKNGEVVYEFLERLIEDNSKTISFDGDLMIYVESNEEGHELIESRLVAKSLSNKRTHELLNNPKVIPVQPDLSHNGKYIAFIDEYAGGGNVFIIEVGINE